MRALQIKWDRDRGVPCKQHGIAIEVWRANNMGLRLKCAMKTANGIAIEVCHANSMGSRLKCVMQTVWDRDRGVLCK